MRKAYKLSLVINIVLLLTLIPAPEQVHAQWPPFKFKLTPSYDSGKITYRITFSKQVDWEMIDVTFKIRLPEGTRFLEADAQATTGVDFDGAEITFFTSVFHHPIKNAFFVVEVTDPAMTVFTTHAWIAWKGDQPGDYLAEDVSIDLTRPSLTWEAPPQPRLQLEASATVADDIITYAIYPKKVGGLRMWDLKINIPMPEGTTFLSAEAPPPFVASFDGREVSFSVSELGRWATVDPLSFKVSTEGVTSPFVTTHAWATWKNSNRRVGKSIVAQEETLSGDIVVQPHTSQWVAVDMAGDVPLPNYDITGLVFQDDGFALKIIFHMAGELGPVGEPSEYILYIDSDCRTNTGLWKNYRGVEYRVKYRHNKGRATISLWDEEERKWGSSTSVEVNSPPDGNRVAIWAPYGLIGDSRQFCWAAEAYNKSKAFSRKLPWEKMPNKKDLRLTQYGTGATVNVAESAVTEPTAGDFVNAGDVWQYLPGWSEPPSAWNSIGFDDSNWFSGPTAIGYGDGDYATNLSLVTHPVQNDDLSLLVQHTITQSGMILAVLPSGDYGSVFMRRAFAVADPGSLTQLTLEVDYEGGFVAYLNGVEVARRGLGAPGSPVAYDVLNTDEEIGTSESIDLSNYIVNLVSGVNVLAIQTHRSVNSPNLAITPKLSWNNYPWNVTEQVDIIPLNDSDTPVSAPPAASSLSDISGKLAVPLDNGRVAYDVFVFSLPDGQEMVKIPNARQPNFHFDGQRLLINREGGGVENLFEYNLADGTEKQVSDAPQDWHPFYDPWGNRVVYGNSELTVGKALPKIEDGQVVRHETGEIDYHGPRQPFIFVQCGLLPPHQETEPRCHDIPGLGVLIPAGQMGEIQGTHPVWTFNDMIAYKGCNSWAGFGLCGIYIVPSSSTKGLSDGFIPRQLTRESSDTPSDTKNNLIAFTSQRDGDFEAYIIDLNGQGLRNLSNSPDSSDGLPTISPDGHWVAFISDRDGRWAIWAVPVVGGSVQKLFDLPADIPWGDGPRVWMNERISWGP